MAFLQDLRYGARRIWSTPAFSIIVLVTLALGIGANAAIFSVIDAVLLRPLPYPEAERLVSVNHPYPSYQGLMAGIAAPSFPQYRDEPRSFAGQGAAMTFWEPNLTREGEPERLIAALVSGRYFEVLGVAPALGRTIQPDDDARGRHQVVVLSDGLWRRLGSDPGIAGRHMLLDGESHQVIAWRSIPAPTDSWRRCSCWWRSPRRSCPRFGPHGSIPRSRCARNRGARPR